MLPCWFVQLKELCENRGYLARSYSYHRKGENSGYDEHIGKQNSRRRRADIGQLIAT